MLCQLRTSAAQAGTDPVPHLLVPAMPRSRRLPLRPCLVWQEEAEAEGAAQPAMMDPITDLKLNQLDIVDLVRERQALLQVLTQRMSPTGLILSCAGSLTWSHQLQLCGRQIA